jgi:hypothetical protein
MKRFESMAKPDTASPASGPLAPRSLKLFTWLLIVLLTHRWSPALREKRPSSRYISSTLEQKVSDALNIYLGESAMTIPISRDQGEVTGPFLLANPVWAHPDPSGDLDDTHGGPSYRTDAQVSSGFG